MYKLFKTILNAVFPGKMRYKMEPLLRGFYAVFKKGKNHLCVICTFKTSSFELLPNADLLCPKCGSLSRDRRLWKTISENYLQANTKILDFSPSRCLYRKWKKELGIEYVASDLSDNFIATVAYDITQIPKQDNQFDLIICYHILEHVIDDMKAMTELYRVLKPNGSLLVQTPFKDGDIYEDYNITSEPERLSCFGQEDHVRVYSVQGLKNRLENVKFKVNVNQYNKDNYLGFSESEFVLIATK
jgi:SAM-dependent methyltransferase